MNIENIIAELRAMPEEKEWFEFKENWFQPEALGEYVSALSNAAAVHHKKYAYFIWGIDDETHEITGTTFNQYSDHHKEPYQNYLARNLSPSINFKFEEADIDGKRVVVLIIPAAEEVPTSFRDKRYLRIGSSKCNLKDYPKREIELFKILDGRTETIENKPAKYQDLTFNKLFGYYGSKGITLNEKTFVKNLGLMTEDGKYNILAQLLSDDSHFPVRVSIFTGKNKASDLFAVREFGYNCLLYTLDDLLRYGDVLNIRQADERNRIVERKEVLLFDSDAFREAMINAVLHNKWVDGNEPMISVFSDRIEILSRGTLAPMQTMEGFFIGESVPVNEKLSEIFLQLHISEKSGRGVPKIIDKYSRDIFTFRENSIVVTIPFEWINSVEEKNNYIEDKTEVPKEKNDIKSDAIQKLNARCERILLEMKNNPEITVPELSRILGVSETTVNNNILILKTNGYIKRLGSRKFGQWKILKDN